MNTRHPFGVRTIVLWAFVIGAIVGSYSSEAVGAECAAAPDGVVGWWSAENSAQDVAAANHGSLLNGTTFGPGIVGQAFSFDSINDSVLVPASPTTDVGTAAGLTIEVWVKPARLHIGPIAEWNDGAGGHGAHLWHSIDSVVAGDGPGNIYANLVDITGISHRITSLGGLLTTNGFHHVALTYDKATGVAVIYHNGTAVMTQNLGTFTPLTSYDLHFGKRADGPFSENLYQGLIDEPSLYNRALSATEITAIHAAGSAGKCVLPTEATSWEAASDFATNANPNGAWSYGYSTALGGAFTPHASRGIMEGIEYWRTDFYGNNPGAFHNPGSANITNLTVILKPNQLALHPGDAGEFSVLRFTTPKAGTYRVQGSFVGADTRGTTTDAHVLLATGSIWDAAITGYEATSAKAFDTTLGLNAGDKLDFAVGPGGNGFYYDATGISVRISLITSSSPIAPPLITDFTPKSAAHGTAVTMIGSNFSPVAASNIVYFGAVRAVVSAASATSLTVVVPSGSLYAPITATVGGLVAAAPTPFQPTFTGGGAALSVASFQPRFDLAGGDGAHRSAIADLDGDGKPDLAVANVYGHTISIFRNLSTTGTLNAESFAARVDLSAPGGGEDNPYGFGTADVDGDGKLDLVACDRLGNNVSVYRNTATVGTLNASSFAPYVNFPVGADPRYARVADLDGDGRPDIVSCNYAANTISILRNLGTAGALDTSSFAPRVDLPAGTGPYDVAIGDLDGDGKPDLAVVDLDGLSMSVYRNVSTTGTLDASSFAPRVSFPAPDGSGTIAFGDIDGDGKPDLVIGSFKAYSMSVYRNQATAGVLDTNSFAARVDFSTGNWTHNLALSDLNGDGKTDIATVGELESYASLFQNLSTPGSFNSASLGSRVDLGAGWNGWGITAGDLDGDGRPDLVFCNAYDYTVSLYHNLIAPVPVDPPAITQQPAGQAVAVSDAVTFSVSATGAAPLSYQWLFNEDNLADATNSTLPLSNVQLAQGGNYSVVVSNPFGSVTSSNAVLTVNGLSPAITSQPQDRSVYAGKTVTFNVAVSGSAPLRYQWRKNDAPIANATNTSITLANVQFGDAGLYDVAITNLFGGTTSRLASLTVNPAPACVPVPEGAVAWWPGQSNTWDVLGGFDVTPFQLLGYAPGVVGSAFKIRAPGYLMAPNLPELNLGTGVGFTVECWVNPDSDFGSVFGWSEGSSFPSFPTWVNLRIISPGLLEAQLWGTNNSLTILRTPVSVVQVKAWQHVALTHDRVSGEVNIFHNGVSVARTNLGSKGLRTSGYFRLGSGSGQGFSGLIDEPALYKRALSKSEIESIYLADLAGKCPPSPPSCVIPPTDIAAWWRGESNTLDSVAGNHARVIPTNFSIAGTYQTGVVNTALAFRGQNFFSVPRSENLDLGTAPGMTIEAWILPTRTSPMPIVEWTDSNSFGANLWMNYSSSPTVLAANLIDSSGGSHLIQSRMGTLSINAWQHVALTYNKASGMAALYVNGNTVVTTNVGSFTPRTDLPLLLGFHPPNISGGTGGAPPSSSYWFAGAMDEVSLYRRALNSQEIRDLSRTRSVKCLDLPPTIGMQPQDQVAMAGGAASLAVVAGGTAPLGYQWFLGGEPIAGATAPALSLPAAGLADAGAYTVLVSNALGTAISRTATITVLPANQCLPTPWGAVAFWRGESNTVDELGNHPAQWASNTVPGYTSRQVGGGKVNTAFRFTGSNHLLVQSNANLNVGAGGGFTVEGWFKPDSQAGIQSLVDWNDGRGNIGVGLMYARTGPGALEVTLTDTNAYNISERVVTFATPNYAIGSPSNSIPPWSHVALTFDRVSGKATLLVNGKVAAERTIGPVLTYTSPQTQRVPFKPATTGSLYFGRRPSGNFSGYFYRGAMDEMTVYYRALTPLELQAIYVVGANGKCTPQPSCQPVTESVAAWWRAEGDLRDSLFTNSAIAIGRPSYTNGASGAAWRLDGNNYLRVPASPRLNVGASDGLTVEAWVNLASTSSPYAIADWTGQGVTFGSSQTRGPSYLEANLVDTAGRSHLITSPFGAVTNNSWHHVAVIYDKLTGLSALFVNGAPITVTNLGLFTPNTTNQLHLGYRPALGARLIGGLDEVMIHRRALSSGEITASYRNAANRCMKPPVIVQQPQPASLRVNAGGDVTFTVLAAGNPVLRYQWFRNGFPIYDRSQKGVPFEMQPSLSLTNLIGYDEAVYRVVVSNAFGFAVSSNVTLLVNYAPLADASATVPLHISPNGTDAIAVLDGSRSTDRDRDALSYQWFLNDAATPLSTGMVAVVTLPVGINSITLVVSDGLLTHTDQVTVEVLTTAQAVDRLAALVADEAANPQPLLATLRAALAAIDRSRPATAINQLEAFINKVRAQVAPVDAELAARLIAEAQAIIDALNGGTAPVADSIEITSITQEGNGKPHLGIRGKAGRTLIIETSTDGVNWEKIGVAADKGAGKFEFDDAGQPAAAARFYRVVSPK